jgi:flavodoxin
MKTLIVYHSRTGHTRRVAQALAKRLGADLEEITVLQPHDGAFGYAQCALEAMTMLTPAIHASHHDPAQYELVVIGTPVWFWSLASPVRSWVIQHQGQHQGARPQQVAFFCTMGGSGSLRAFATLETLIGKRPVATLALTEREVSERQQPALDAFVKALHGRAAKKARKPAATARPVRRARATAY